MKLSLAIILSFITTAAIASPTHGHHHRHHGHHHRHWHGPSIHHWVAPALIGGAVVYAATRPDPIIVQQQPPVVLQPNQVIIDGVVYTRARMIVNGVEQEVLVRSQ